MKSIFKLDYDTVRDLERQGFRAFWITGSIFAAGVVLSLTAILIIIGVPLIILGATGFLGSMLWMSMHSKEPTRRIYCPYCSATNEVFKSRSEFSCDICDRRIGIGSEGEPIALEEDDLSHSC